MVDAIRTLDGEGDINVLIVARGGGSLEDLWAFNTEAVARAIFSCHAPVVSAVGHETDVTIADLVADYRAPTPSAAAEAVTPDAVALAMEVAACAQRARSTVSYRLADDSGAVLSLVQRMSGRLPDVAALRQNVDTLVDGGWQALLAMLGDRRERTHVLEAYLNALSPAAVLDRGYAVLVQRATGATVTSAGQVRPGDLLRATVKDGGFDTRVEPEESK